MTNSKAKGKRGELELKDKLSEIFSSPCRRGQQYSGIGGADVVGLKGIHIECKRTESLRLYDAMAQAENDAPDGDVPIVCHRRNNEEWVAIVALEDLPALAKAIEKILTGEQQDNI